MSAAAIFLDKDGTLVEDVPFNVDPEKIRIYPEVPGALRRLAEDGYQFIIISNQAGVAHGYFDVQAVEASLSALESLLAATGVEIKASYYCPHHPEGEQTATVCNCRKPREGLLHAAARDHHIDLSKSWMVGDILNDVEAGKRAGCRAVLIDRGNETEWLEGPLRRPDVVLDDLSALPGVIRNAQTMKNGTLR